MNSSSSYPFPCRRDIMTSWSNIHWVTPEFTDSVADGIRQAMICWVYPALTVGDHCHCAPTKTSWCIILVLGLWKPVMQWSWWKVQATVFVWIQLPSVLTDVTFQIVQSAKRSFCQGRGWLLAYKLNQILGFQISKCKKKSTSSCHRIQEKSPRIISCSLQTVIVQTLYGLLQGFSVQRHNSTPLAGGSVGLKVEIKAKLTSWRVLSFL